MIETIWRVPAGYIYLSSSTYKSSASSFLFSLLFVFFFFFFLFDEDANNPLENDSLVPPRWLGCSVVMDYWDNRSTDWLSSSILVWFPLCVRLFARIVCQAVPRKVNEPHWWRNPLVFFILLWLTRCCIFFLLVWHTNLSSSRRDIFIFIEKNPKIYRSHFCFVFILKIVMGKRTPYITKKPDPIFLFFFWLLIFHFVDDFMQVLWGWRGGFGRWDFGMSAHEYFFVFFLGFCY